MKAFVYRHRYDAMFGVAVVTGVAMTSMTSFGWSIFVIFVGALIGSLVEVLVLDRFE